MEAIAKYDYQSTNEDELSFRANSCLKIIDFLREENSGWYKAELQGSEGLVPGTYVDLQPHDWFKEITRKDAEEMLKHAPDGSFLIRPSENHQAFSITVKNGSKSDHWRIMRDGAGKYFVWVVKFDSLNALVKHYKSSSICRNNKVLLRDDKSPGATASSPSWSKKEEVPPPVMATKQIKVRALYDFEASDAEELTLKKGDIVTLIDKIDQNWWTGSIMRGGVEKKGYFPSNYVEAF
ncbi:unnamed protein product [Owenia fusiformis]|uniref:Uncharacterized protein n=1 Tax=Owenia fusiformis TaxID=6347 RepID=A0A8J1U503_OWEFU|nr:unnamed protein product [Owenia fusiformis]